MIPRNDAPDPGVAERDAARGDLSDSLDIITGQTHALRHQVLRSNGLLNLERDQLLGGLATLLSEVRRMEDRLEILDGRSEPLVEAPAVPGSTSTALPR